MFMENIMKKIEKREERKKPRNKYGNGIKERSEGREHSPRAGAPSQAATPRPSKPAPAKRVVQGSCFHSQQEC